MKHLLIIAAMAISCVLVAVADVVITRTVFGLNVFTFKVWFIIPAGAIFVGMLGTSGAILAARYFSIVPNLIDMLLMVFVAAVTMFSIYYLDYATLVFNNGSKASALMGFYDYVDLVLTKSHMRIGRANVDTGEVGQMGYWLAVDEFIGFLFGGAACFGFIMGMPRCFGCGSYLRKLKKAKTTPELSFDEAGKLLEFFKTGDFAAVKEVLDWRPNTRELDTASGKAMITYKLYGCQKCKSEVVIATPQAFNGKEWKELPKLVGRRTLDASVSLRASFG